MDVNMDDAIKLRQQLISEWSDRGIKPSYTDLVVRAVAKALENHRRSNATFDETEITLRVVSMSGWPSRSMGTAARLLAEVKTLFEVPYRLLV